MKCLVDFTHYLKRLELFFSRWFLFSSWIQEVYFINKGRIGLESDFDPIPVLYSRLFPRLFELQWVGLCTSVPSTNSLPDHDTNNRYGYHTGAPNYSIRHTLYNFGPPNLLFSSQCLFPKWIHGAELLSRKDRRRLRIMLIPSQCLTSWNFLVC